MKTEQKIVSDPEQPPLREIAGEAIASQLAFGELLSADEKRYLLDHGVVRSAKAGDVICEQNQLDARVYILVMGGVEVSEGGGQQKVVLANLRRGEIFGEISALFKLPRISTVTVTRPSVMLELSGEVLETLINNRPLLRDAVLERYRQRIIETALRCVPLFRHLPVSNLKILADHAVLSSFPRNTEIVREHDSGDSLYFIIVGSARVSRRIKGEVLNIALLRQAEYFGEWSVLTGAQRAATVTALSQVVVMEVDCQPFLRFIQDNPQVRDRLDLVAYNRHTQAMLSEGLSASPDARDEIVKEIENIIDRESRF
ncbi:MAG TPA: cyclic nucleotide-binding domain-containing protein [Gammaproteobacteria bacterium]|nr:cyclic nucleotide-binding domain-containing protein [Gammaproteobacteria bacterium]